jgi:hypothetical protein
MCSGVRPTLLRELTSLRQYANAGACITLLLGKQRRAPQHWCSSIVP